MKEVLSRAAQIIILVLLVASCSKSGGQYRIHGSVASVSVKEYNQYGAVIASPTVKLNNGASDVITASKGAISVEVPDQQLYSTYDKKKETFGSEGIIALLPEGITEVWLKIKK